MTVHQFPFVEYFELLFVLLPQTLSGLFLFHLLLFDSSHSEMEIGLVPFSFMETTKGFLNVTLGFVVDCEECEVLRLQMSHLPQPLKIFCSEIHLL